MALIGSADIFKTSHHPDLSRSLQEASTLEQRTSRFSQILLTKGDTEEPVAEEPVKPPPQVLLTKAVAENVPGAIGAKWEGCGRPLDCRCGWSPVFATPVETVGSAEPASGSAEPVAMHVDTEAAFAEEPVAMHVDTEVAFAEEPVAVHVEEPLAEEPVAMHVDTEVPLAELLVTELPSAKVEHMVLLHAKLQN